MGHGLCDNHTKSRTLQEPTDEPEVLLQTALLLLEGLFYSVITDRSFILLLRIGLLFCYYGLVLYSVVTDGTKTALLLLEGVAEEHVMPPDQIRGVGILMTRLTTKA